jgi:hypothetical protein
LGQVTGRVIVGPHAVGSAIAESFPEMSYRAGGEAEAGREAGGGLPLRGALE